MGFTLTFNNVWPVEYIEQWITDAGQQAHGNEVTGRWEAEEVSSAVHSSSAGQEGKAKQSLASTLQEAHTGLQGGQSVQGLLRWNVDCPPKAHVLKACSPGWCSWKVVGVCKGGSGRSIGHWEHDLKGTERARLPSLVSWPRGECFSPLCTPSIMSCQWPRENRASQTCIETSPSISQYKPSFFTN